MPISKGTYARICGQVRPKPLHLSRAIAVVNLAVQSDDMPCSQIEGIIAPAVTGAVGIQRGGFLPKVGVITGCTGNVVIVVAYRWSGAILMATPGWSVAVVKLGCRTIRVDIIAQGKYSPADGIEKICSRLILAIATTTCNIPSSSK
jgi:hypothetical protein